MSINPILNYKIFINLTPQEKQIYANQMLNALEKSLIYYLVNAILDTRLLTEDGRKEIKDDIYTASAITKAIEQITSNDKVGIKDFFDETQQNVDVYNAMKTKIANSEELTKYLQDPNLDPLAKQNMLQEIASTVMKELGYTSNEVKIISTDETGANNTQVKGYYDSNTQTSYVNDKYNNSTSELVSSTGHEIMHDMDKQKGIFVSKDKDQNIYATNFGNNLAYYTEGAINIVNGGSLSSTNNHNNGLVTQYPSVFNTNNVLTGNNKEFANINKSGGDDLPVFVVPMLIGMATGGSIEFGIQTVPQVVGQLNEKGWQPKNINIDEVEIDWIDIGMMTGIGGVAPSGIGAAKSIWNSSKAINSLKKQKDSATAISKINKLDNRIDSHTKEIAKNIAVQTGLGIGKIIIKNTNDNAIGETNE